MQLNGHPVTDGIVKTGGWKVESGVLTPVPNRWNYVLMGDSSAYDYTFSAAVKRTKGSGRIELRVRDNGLSGEQSDYIGMTIGAGICELYRQAGGVRDTLSLPVAYPFQSNRWYRVAIRCQEEQIHCFVNDTLIHEVTLPAIPSLTSTAALDQAKGEIFLKVVNTTWHEERTHLQIKGFSVDNSIEVIELFGHGDGKNTFDNPERIKPTTKTVTFQPGVDKIYVFPPNSISVLKFKLINP